MEANVEVSAPGPSIVRIQREEQEQEQENDDEEEVSNSRMSITFVPFTPRPDDTETTQGLSAVTTSQEENGSDRKVTSSDSELLSKALQPSGDLVSLVDDIPDRPSTPPLSTSTKNSITPNTPERAPHNGSTIVPGTAGGTGGYIVGAPLQAQAAKFIMEKASKDKSYFTTLEPEQPVDTVEGNGATSLSLYGYRELVRRNIIKSNKEMLTSFSDTEMATLDLANLERHLTDDDFFTIFGKTKGEFNTLAGWKQKDEKKKAFLF